jgi:hypothetical protein
MLKQFRKTLKLFIPLTENQLECYTQATNFCVIMFLLLIIEKSMIMNIILQNI